MYRGEVLNTLRLMISEWSTEKSYFEDMIGNLMDYDDIEYYIEDLGDKMSVQFEDEEGKDQEILVKYMLTGTNTWSVYDVI